MKLRLNAQNNGGFESLTKTIVQLCLPGDFSSAREIQQRYLPPMEINFVEWNPGPVKAAMAVMTLLEPVWRLPLVAPKVENLSKIPGILESVGLVQHAYAAH